MNDLEVKNYVATPADIEQVTQAVLDASALSQSSRVTYLRALVGTTQAQLGMPQTKRRTIPPAMDPQETTRQLEAIEEVHKRFYEAVMKAVQGTPVLEHERGQERRLVWAARANFARSAKSTLRAWVSSGNNIRALVPGKVTKYALEAEIVRHRGHPVRAPSERFLEGAASKLLERIKAAKSPEESIKLLESMINKLVAGLMDLGVETTTKLEDAIRDGKLLQTQTGIVWAARAEPARQPSRRSRTEERAVA